MRVAFPRAVVFVRRAAFVALPLTFAALHASSTAARQTSSPPVREPVRQFVPALGEVPRPTRIEALLATPGVVVSADYYPIDMRFGPGLALDAVVVTAVDTRSRLRGVRLQVNDDRRPNPREASSFLDFDEVTSLSQALGTMVDLTAKWTGRDAQRNTELSFVTVGGFRLTVHQSIRTQRVSAFTGLLEPVGTTVEVTDLPAFKLAVDQAVSTLNSK